MNNIRQILIVIQALTLSKGIQTIFRPQKINFSKSIKAYRRHKIKITFYQISLGQIVGIFKNKMKTKIIKTMCQLILLKKRLI